MNNIPDTLAEISSDWLSGRLEADVQSVTVADEHHGTTGRALIDLHYAGGHDDKLPRSLFVKLPPSDPQQREFVISTGMGKREADFYAQLASEVKIRVPRCYYATSDEAGEHYIMLLENLEQSGCTFRNASKHYSMDYIRSAIDSFARLHAAFMQSPRFETDLNWIQAPMLHPMGPLLVKRALDHYRDQLPAVFSEAAELYLGHTEAVHALWRAGQPTLVHGDIHDGNMFADHGKAGFLDWALVCRTSGMRDLANFMVGSMKPEDREAHQQDLIEGYRQGLVEAGVEAPGFEPLWQQYQWHALYTWVAAATTVAMGSEWQPINYTMKTLERVHRALDNIGSIASIRSTLSL